MNYLFLFTEHSNFAANRKITKLMPAINELSVSIYLSMLRKKTNLVIGDFSQPVNTDGFSWDILKIVQIYERFDDVNKMQIKQR